MARFERAKLPHRMNTTVSGFAETDFDHPIGEVLPPEFGVTPGLVRSHREYGVEQKDAVARPRLEAAVAGLRDPEIGSQLFVNVAQRRRDLDATRDREAEATGLTWTVIRVLAQDDHPGVAVGREMKGREDIVVFGVDVVFRARLRGCPASASSTASRTAHAATGSSRSPRIGTLAVCRCRKTSLPVFSPPTNGEKTGKRARPSGGGFVQKP